jgi:hypothetical protein
MVECWAQRFPWLSTLDLSRWSLALHDAEFHAQALTLRHLTALVIAGKNELSDQQLATIGEYSCLRRLSLTHCNKVENARAVQDTLN